MNIDDATARCVSDSQYYPIHSLQTLLHHLSKQLDAIHIRYTHRNAERNVLEVRPAKDCDYGGGRGPVSQMSNGVIYNSGYARTNNPQDNIKPTQMRSPELPLISLDTGLTLDRPFLALVATV